MPNCPQCGEELDSDDPAGLCPNCLIQGAFDSSLGGDLATRTIDIAPASGDDDFGRYHIVRPLGEGGMGTVYLAEQREPIRRAVALKVVKLGMDTSQVLARFAIERQALAMMDHPNIARILDAGATPKGRPYFVMEYIEGAPITQYCDRKRMTIGERLELFLTVCRALQHAHQKGVIHRDIKPSNVLVTEQEGKPVPKVIDFGIAKATDQWAVEKTLLTQFGQMVGTPEYASPEQAEVTTGDVDEASDVYSLGVLLYELLIGTVPFDVARMRKAGLPEMLRIIREDEAPKLAQKLSTVSARASEIAAHRQTDASSLRRLVDGDLTWITMKALEKGRERRYASVTDLASDIQRYIEHRPVIASPPSRLYRARKLFERRKPAVLSTIAGVAFVILGAVTIWSFARHESPAKPASTGKRTIVLADFANATGDTAFDGTLRQILTAQLGTSAYLALLPDGRMIQTLRLMLRAPETKITPQVAAEICERTASDAVVEGSVASLGNEYVLDLRARNCRTGDLLDEEQSRAGRKDDVVKTLGQIVNRFQADAGRWLPSVKKEASLPADVTTASLEAWRSYSAAMKALQHRAHIVEVIPMLQRAVAIDPQFAMGYAYLGRQYDSLGESELSAKNIARAYELRERASAEENYFITFNYQRNVTRNLELARQTLEAWAELNPNDLVPHGFLAAFTAQGSGHFDRAVEEGLKAIALDQNYAIGYENVAFAYIYQNQLQEADALLRKAEERKIDSLGYSLCRYFIAFLRHDDAALEKEITQRKAKLEAQGWFEHQEALTMAYHGRVKEAAGLSERAIVLTRQAHLDERAAQFAGARAAWSALLESRTDAKNSAAEALQHRSRDADYGPAFALALLGDSSAHAIAAELETNYQEDTSVQFSYLPVIKALEALHQGAPATALKIAEKAYPYDLAIPGTAFYTGAFYGALYPVYVRGLAYSRMGRHREAAAEFQNIVDHRYITLNDPIGPMARLQLARELHALGDRTKAAVVYEELLKIWKGADTDLRPVQDAKAESAR